MAKHHIIRAELTLNAKKILTELSKNAGTTEIKFMSRLVSWVLDQDELVQAGAFKRLPGELDTEVAKCILQRLIERSRR